MSRIPTVVGNGNWFIVPKNNQYFELQDYAWGGIGDEIECPKWIVGGSLCGSPMGNKFRGCSNTGVYHMDCRGDGFFFCVMIGDCEMKF